MSQVPDVTRMANDLQPDVEIAHDLKNDSEKSQISAASEKASVVEGEVQDAAGAWGESHKHFGVYC